jgi:hypothetical protein
MWARAVFAAEVVVTAVGGWFIAAPGQGYAVAAVDAFSSVMAIVVVSGCVGFALSRRGLARRLLLVNSATVPVVGLFAGWARGNPDTRATWYGYLLLWAVMVAISLLASLAGYVGARGIPPQGSTQV